MRNDWDWAKCKEATRRARWYARRGGRYVRGPYGAPGAPSPILKGRRGLFVGEPMRRPR